MQKWIPSPKARCGLGRAAVEAVGLGEDRRVAVGRAEQHVHALPSATGRPSISRSAVAVRSKRCSGLSCRSSSSASRARAASSSTSTAGEPAVIHEWMPLLRPLTLASWPALSRSTTVATSSCRLSASPASRAWTRSVSRSSPGWRARCAAGSSTDAAKSEDARRASARACSLGPTSYIATMAWLHGRSRWRSACGQSSSSAMTVTGSGSATASARSKGPSRPRRRAPRRSPGSAARGGRRARARRPRRRGGAAACASAARCRGSSRRAAS